MPRPDPSTDPERLVPALKRGDPAALTTLYRAFGGELLALATRITGSREDAEDVLHDLIVGLPEALRHYQEQGKLGSWLKQIVVRSCLMRARAQKIRQGDTADPDDLPARSRDTELAPSIEMAFGELAPAIRTVVVLRLVDGFSHAEIAETLGISVDASQARLSRGVALLR